MPNYRTKTRRVDAFRLGRQQEGTPFPSWFNCTQKMVTPFGIVFPRLNTVLIIPYGCWVVHEPCPDEPLNQWKVFTDEEFEARYEADPN